MGTSQPASAATRKHERLKKRMTVCNKLIVQYIYMNCVLSNGEDGEGDHSDSSEDGEHSDSGEGIG